MTSYTDRGPKPETGEYQAFDHIVFWVGNAKQAAAFYCLRFGFRPIAYKGLETGCRDRAHHVVRGDRITFEFVSTYSSNDTEFNQHLSVHGDGVRDVAFTVKDARGIYDMAVKRGAVSVQAPVELTDANGTVVLASVRTYGDTVHTFVDRSNYRGGEHDFMPSYHKPLFMDPLLETFVNPNLAAVDHCVGNQPDNEMLPAVEWYEKCLQFHRFWSVDDSQMHTEYSALRSIVMTDYDEAVRMPINEPAVGLRKSQIQEYVDYYGGAGVQHIALNTHDIIHAVTTLRSRGVEFLTIPEKYYINLRQRLQSAAIKVTEDLDALQKLHILVDFDENGYLLQIFTKPLEDRPTLFVEIIQRHNHYGFGAGNFKALFESIEHEQDKRGNL